MRWKRGAGWRGPGTGPEPGWRWLVPGRARSTLLVEKPCQEAGALREGFVAQPCPDGSQVCTGAWRPKGEEKTTETQRGVPCAPLRCHPPRWPRVEPLPHANTVVRLLSF